jgi:hypothetical protein
VAGAPGAGSRFPASLSTSTARTVTQGPAWMSLLAVPEGTARNMERRVSTRVDLSFTRELARGLAIFPGSTWLASLVSLTKSPG